jgi:two-component system LytT family sensor kinase
MTPARRTMRLMRIWGIILLGCLFVGILDGLQIGMKGLVNDDRVHWPTVSFQTSEWILFGLLSIITYFLGVRAPLQRGRLPLALAIHAAGAVLLCLSWALAGVVLRRALGIGWDMPMAQELHDWTLITLPWSFILYFAVLGTFHAFHYYAEARARELQATQLTAQLSEARLHALRTQLQPHFLFNALNAVTVLVRDQRGDTAVRILEQLSEMLRQVLRTDRPHLIPLRDELLLLRQYLDIEQIRFSDRLRVEYQLDADALNGLVPAFILQPLVENALRHGLADQLGDALIEISARRAGNRLELSVRDNGRGLTEQPRAGIGLENTRERLATLYGSAARLELRTHPQGGAVALLQIPWSSEAS